MSAFSSFGAEIANSLPATQQTQNDSASKIIGSVVQGTIGIIQTIKSPTKPYPSVLAGYTAGSGGGATQQQQSTTNPPWIWALLGAAGIAIVTAGALALKHAR